MTSTACPPVAVAAGTYRAYGLTIHSPIELREYPAGSGSDCDVQIIWTEGGDPEWTAPFRDQDSATRIDGSEAHFWFRETGTFVVSGGTAIQVCSHPGVGAELLRLYLEGMMMAMILHQRGLCVLHASVIEVRGAAIACIGHIGAGKSSTAAALYARGHRILTDDNAAIRLTSGQPVVTPGYPSIKLFPAIAASLAFDSGSLSTLHETQIKMAGAVDSTFSDRPLPLRTIYILGRDHAPEMTRLSPLEATIHLIRNAVPTRWGQPGDARQLQQCAAIANQIPVFAVKTFRELSELPGLVDQLEHHQGVQSTLETNAALAAF